MCLNLESLLISLIWLSVLIGIIQILVPWIMGMVAIPAPILSIINLIAFLLWCGLYFRCFIALA